jgi:sulfatase modifying factor 1
VGSRENLPIHCENWWEAYAFCIWDGGFLPSAAEWEYVAVGGSEQGEYPWGSVDPGVANQYAIYGDDGLCYYPTLGPCTGLTNIAPVGTTKLGAGRWGQLDLAGNVEEWTSDWAGTPGCAWIVWSSRPDLGLFSTRARLGVLPGRNRHEGQSRRLPRLP